ncbi:UNVERIFIED_CONTAM: oxygen-independent coproporphyrinogen-3 oxidase [Acetivibrio alkalicellulosi]
MPINVFKQYMYSYPHKTAYQYTKKLGLKNYQKELNKNPATLYFHIPFCETKCGYCNLFSIPNNNSEKIDSYIEALRRHSESYTNILKFEDVHFETLVMGGGTPLILSIKQLEKLFHIAQYNFKIDLNKVYISIETSPNQTCFKKLEFLKSQNANRISIGIQSFVQTELDMLRRFHSVKQSKAALEHIKKVGFDRVNIDLIYGINSQTMDSLQFSLEEALLYEPDEIFAYPLYQKPHTAIYKEFDIDRELQYRMYFKICEFLRQRGYIQISMRKFVKQQDLKEMSCGFENMISLGCGGRSYIGNLHFSERYTSRKSKCRTYLEKYISRKEFFDNISFYVLNEDEMKRRFLIKNLLHCKGVDLVEYKNVFKRDLLVDFPMIDRFVDEGWVFRRDKKFILTSLGLSLSDFIGPMLISDDVAKKMEMFCDD